MSSIYSVHTMMLVGQFPIQMIGQQVLLGVSKHNSSICADCIMYQTSGIVHSTPHMEKRHNLHKQCGGNI